MSYCGFAMDESTTWACVDFADLGVDRLYRILRLRERVFVVEQNCPYLDADGEDPKAIHLYGQRHGDIVAYARLFCPNKSNLSARIGRVAVDPEYRKQNLGRRVMENALQYLKTHHGSTGPVPIEISAQTYLLKFYQSLGFTKKGTEYLEDGIPHITMRATL